MCSYDGLTMVELVVVILFAGGCALIADGLLAYYSVPKGISINPLLYNLPHQHLNGVIGWND